MSVGEGIWLGVRVAVSMGLYVDVLVTGIAVGSLKVEGTHPAIRIMIIKIVDFGIRISIKVGISSIELLLLEHNLNPSN